MFTNGYIKLSILQKKEKETIRQKSMLDLINACTSAADLSFVKKFLNDFIFDSSI